MDTSWKEVAGWYDRLVNDKGHEFHKEIIFPKLKQILTQLPLPLQSVLDIGCGQGIAEKFFGNNIRYVGIDQAKPLIEKAEKHKLNPNSQFIVADASKPFPLKTKGFSHALMLLSLQNMADPKKVLSHIHPMLQKEGILILVLNHPCFRIPRQTHWEEDKEKKIQYRRVDRYLSSMKIPIATHPSKGKASPKTWSFHESLSTYFQALYQAGFYTLWIEEWATHKKSTGGKAKMENRAKSEIPLFLTIVAKCIIS